MSTVVEWHPDEAVEIRLDRQSLRSHLRWILGDVKRLTDDELADAVADIENRLADAFLEWVDAATSDAIVSEIKYLLADGDD
jgi:hypothetical protein